MIDSMVLTIPGRGAFQCLRAKMDSPRRKRGAGRGRKGCRREARPVHGCIAARSDGATHGQYGLNLQVG